MKSYKNVFSVFSLVIFQFVLVFFGFHNHQEFTNINERVQTRNDNNNAIVTYPDGLYYIGLGSNINTEVVEDEANGQQFVVKAGSSYQFGLQPGYDVDDAKVQIPTNTFVLYDETNNFKKISSTEVAYGDYLVYNWNDSGEQVIIDCQLSQDVVFDAIGLDEFHDYRIGVNLNKGDDLNVFSSSISLSKPELTKFEIISTDDSFTIEYELMNPSPAVTFEYNELYVKVGKKVVDLDTTQRDLSGSVTIDNLNPAREYDVVFGYDLTKVVSSTIQYDIDNEFNFVASTKVPTDYLGEEVIAIASILLLILLIVLFILILTIVYWNHQRRKITDLSLVMGNDQQETPYQNDEVAGYFDEVYDDEPYQDEEIAGYFDEVYEDEERGINNYDSSYEDYDDYEDWEVK